MPSLTQPRSLSKTMAIAAISLLAAGFITALGFGLRGYLWEIKKANADLIAAQASIEIAKAQVLKAMNELEAAKVTANATIGAAQIQSQATIGAAQIQGQATVGAAVAANVAETSTTQNILNPYLADPAGSIAKLQAELSRLDFEITKDTNIQTGRPLTTEERQDRSERKAKTELQLEYAKKSMKDTANAGMGIVGAYFGSMMDLIKLGAKKDPGEVAFPAPSSPVENKRRAFGDGRRPGETPPPRINPEPFDAPDQTSPPATIKPEPTSDLNKPTSIDAPRGTDSYQPRKTDSYQPRRSTYSYPPRKPTEPLRPRPSDNPQERKYPEP